MSRETIADLNKNSMIGFIKNRDTYKDLGWGIRFDETLGQNIGWWHTDGFENGYDGAIPVEEVERVLFNWEPVETEIMHKRRDVTEAMADGIDGIGPFLWVPSERFKGIMHPETEHEFGIFGIDSYNVHGYKKWLVDGISTIVDSEVGIATAGLLRQGGVAYVTVEMPDNVTVAGLDIRPQLLACTSIDGTKATTYKAVTQLVVCDNTLDLAISKSDTGTFKVRHSSRSLGRLQEARDALGIVYQQAEDMTEFIESLSDVDVTDSQFRQIVQAFKPVPDPEPGVKGGKPVVVNQRAITIAENVQGELLGMYARDPRCAPWNGTLLGAMQTFNTYNNHNRSNTDNGVDRVMMGAINGATAKYDREFFQIVKDLDGLSVPDSLASLV